MSRRVVRVECGQGSWGDDIDLLWRLMESATLDCMVTTCK